MKLVRNDISPILTRLKARLEPGQRKDVLRAMGTVFMSITQGNFNSVSSQYRPIPWRAKLDGSPATLKKSGLLSHSFHLEVTSEYARVYNPTPYAAIHQYGGKTRPHKITAKSGKALHFQIAGKNIFAASVNHSGSNIPARPFFPVLNGKLTPAAEKLILAAAYRAILKA